MSAVRVKPLPDAQVLRELLIYDEATGNLSWKSRTADQMPTTDPRGPEWAASSWNARYAGASAFTATDHRGYKHGHINSTKYQAHRVVWKMVHGDDPDYIDHINGDPSDNRLANLRSCSNAENSRNYRKSVAGKSSRFRGVCWVERDQAWAARISNGKGGKKSLGNYRDEVEAAKAYDRAALDLHGEFAVLNFPKEA